MSFKTSAVLLIILAALGGFVYYLPPQAAPKSTPAPDHIWQVDLADIFHMDLTYPYQGQVIDLNWDDDKREWSFGPKSVFQGKVDQLRLNGIRLLLSGPGSKRTLFQDKVSDLAPFGLAQPRITANIILKDKTEYRILLGDTTSNGQSTYLMLDGRPEIWTVDFTWAGEMTRMYSEPPIAKDEAGITIGG